MLKRIINTVILFCSVFTGYLNAQTHFQTVWTGNPYMAMNVYVTQAVLNNEVLLANDEIAVFDGAVCVAVKKLTSPIPSGGYLSLIASTDDPGTIQIDGFITGDSISFKIWKSSTATEITTVIAAFTTGTGKFISQGTAVVNLKAEINSGTVKVIHPNGGESCFCGTSQNITWSSSGITNVKIEYTTNNGTNWSTIISSISASKEIYNWVIPNTPSTLCKIKISDVVNDKINDLSDNVFSIKNINVISPNGGENWIIGSLQNIKWSAIGITNVKVEYSTNNGTDWLTITNSTQAASGTYSWTVLNTPSMSCIVRVSDTNNLSVSDESDNIFAIFETPKIVVLSPNGGENWAINTKENITWSSTGIMNVKIEYSINNGINWTTITTSIPSSDRSYNWTVPNSPSTQCMVKISDAVNNKINDLSDYVFSIKGINLISPIGRESWIVGTTQNILWSCAGITNIKIEYSASNGGTWTTITNNASALTGSYSWVVPCAPSLNCKIRLSDAGNSSVNTVSDNKFTIKGIILFSPNGGEHWVSGTRQNIFWDYAEVTDVKIEYSSNSGTNWTAIIAGTPASIGTYNWTVPNFSSTQCIIRVSDSGNSGINDVSDNKFEINSGTSVEKLFDFEKPSEYKLFQNYPNPFNPKTVIYYSVPENSTVSLKVYDALGNEIASLVNEEKTVGTFKVEFDGSRINSGVYIYTIQAGSYRGIKKLLLLK